MPAVLILQLLLIRMPVPEQFTTEARRHDVDQFYRMVEAAQNPVLSDDMVLPLKSGKEVPLEPMIFAGLAGVGRWEKYFQYVVTKPSD